MSDLSSSAIEAALRGNFGRPCRYHDVVDSTNSLAMQWAADGAPEGSVVVTDHQTGGRGRWGRSWSSQPGRLLQFSVVLRPNLPMASAGLVATAVGVAVAAGVESLTGLRTGIKWPNDVQVNGRKVSGNLIETQAEGDVLSVAIAGVGINVGWTAEEIPAEIRERATSLAVEGAPAVDRARLLASVLEALEMRTVASDVELIEEATRRSVVIGRSVRIRYPDGRIEEGRAEAFDTAGALVLQTSSGPALVHLAEVEQVRETERLFP